MSIEELSHTADVRMRVRALTLNLLFAEACTALMQTVFGDDTLKGGHQKQLQIESKDTESLLMDFLSEILFICEVEGLVFSKATVSLGENSLEALLDGEPFDRARHAGGTEVKGISYSGLAITQDTNGYMLDILFDV